MAATTTASERRARLPLIAVLAGNAVSLIGSTLTTLAVPWFVLVTTGSPGKTGLTAAAAVLPMIVAGTFGGTVVDRLGYKRASVLADATSGIAIALIPLLYHTAGLAFWQLLLLVFLAGLFDAPGLTARQSLIPELTALAGSRLERVNSAFASIGRGAQLLGAPLAGILVAAMGAGNVIWLDAASFGVSALAVATIVPSAARRETSGGEPYLDQLRAGLGFIRRDPLIRTFVGFILITNFVGSPIFAVVLPVYARTLLGGPVALGALLGSVGAGALAGALLYGLVAARVPRRGTFLGGFIVNSVTLLLLAATPGLFAACALLALNGLAAGPLNPLLMTMSHERIPEALRGRVFGLIMALAWLAMPAGLFAGGYLVQSIGVAPVILASGALQLAASLAMVFAPALRQMERR